jgi:hypothetical protein
MNTFEEYVNIVISLAICQAGIRQPKTQFIFMAEQKRQAAGVPMLVFRGRVEKAGSRGT